MQGGSKSGIGCAFTITSPLPHTACAELDENDEEALQRTIAKAKRLYATFDQPKRNQKIQTYCVRKGFNISAIKEVLEGESE